MKFIVQKLIIYILKIAFWFRYKVELKDFDKIDRKSFSKNGGVLFLPNHPTIFVDPTILTIYLWKKFPIRPMISEDFYYMKGIHWLMNFINALPVPNFEISTNSIKRKRGERVIQTVIDGIEKGENFLIYPAGRTKQTNLEVIGGSSAVHKIIQNAPDANIVLVRTKGLWGSSFSRALTGKSPDLMNTMKNGLKSIFKNLIFFTPRRKVIIEFEIAPNDFPFNEQRIKMNRWLENWYNRPDGLTKQVGNYPGESLILVSYSMWKKEIPEIKKIETKENNFVDPNIISQDVKEKVLKEISKITQIPIQNIDLKNSLTMDLGMDSLDISELSIFIQQEFDVKNAPVTEITTVGKCIAIADRKIVCSETKKNTNILDYEKWNEIIPREKIKLSSGNIIPEVFFNNSNKMKNKIACADEIAGILRYKDLKLRIILLADKLRSLKGDRIGILLPSSVAAYAVILACQLAGKVPMLINWTMGPRHLEAIKYLSNVQVILSSWSFIDRLNNVDLDPIENELVMLEDLRKTFTLRDKIKAFLASKLSTEKLLKKFKISHLNEDSEAVLLFTSGTESLPKGVPLTHKNILSNMKQVFNTIDLYSDDILFGILPPFHAFGFTISGLLALLGGVKIVYAADPTDGAKLASMVKAWKASIMCGAPTFLKTMFKSGTPESFKTLRLCVTGAEKAPPELFELAKRMKCRQSLFEGYGITECSPVLTLNRPGKEPAGVGEPLEGVSIKIVHPETFEPLKGMERGLILVSGANIFNGYLNKDVSSPFIELEGKKWFNTGDLGYIDDSNRLIISGRKKRFVKMGGEMISLTSIEDALLQQAPKRGWKIAEEGPTLAVCAREESDSKTKIFLFTIFDTNINEVNLALKEAGFSNLVKISEVIKLDEIPIMGSGKIFYRELENTYM